jgi:hypothetical protein
MAATSILKVNNNNIAVRAVALCIINIPGGADVVATCISAQKNAVYARTLDIWVIDLLEAIFVKRAD